MELSKQRQNLLQICAQLCLTSNLRVSDTGVIQSVNVSSASSVSLGRTTTKPGSKGLSSNSNNGINGEVEGSGSQTSRLSRTCLLHRNWFLHLQFHQKNHMPWTLISVWCGLVHLLKELPLIRKWSEASQVEGWNKASWRVKSISWKSQRERLWDVIMRRLEPTNWGGLCKWPSCVSATFNGSF